jgi:hypothetical protein
MSMLWVGKCLAVFVGMKIISYSMSTSIAWPYMSQIKCVKYIIYVIKLTLKNIRLMWHICLLNLVDKHIHVYITYVSIQQIIKHHHHKPTYFAYHYRHRQLDCFLSNKMPIIIIMRSMTHFINIHWHGYQLLVKLWRSKSWRATW